MSNLKEAIMKFFKKDRLIRMGIEAAMIVGGTMGVIALKDEGQKNPDIKLEENFFYNAGIMLSGMTAALGVSMAAVEIVDYSKKQNKKKLKHSKYVAS